MIILNIFILKKCPIIQSAISEHYKIRKSTQTFYALGFLFINQILTLKKENHNASTSALENKIDRLVYKLDELTVEKLNLIRA